MSVYYNLAKLGRVKLPSGTTYALIDVDCRKMITENYTSEASYSTGDLVIGTGLTGDNITFNDCLLRAKSDIPAGPFDSSKWEVVTVASEIHRLEDAIAGGIHYRGKTSTGLYDGSSTNPIVINDESYTAGAGDLVIVDRSSAAVNYAINTAYSAHTYVKYNSLYYITNAAITASENTSWSAVEAKMDVVKSDPMFLFDGTLWDLVDSESEGLGEILLVEHIVDLLEVVLLLFQQLPQVVKNLLQHQLRQRMVLLMRHMLQVVLKKILLK